MSWLATIRIASLGDIWRILHIRPLVVPLVHGFAIIKSLATF